MQVRDNPIMMLDIPEVNRQDLDYIRERPELVEPDGYELIEIVGSKQMKINDEWQELGYYMTFRKVEDV